MTFATTHSTSQATPASKYLLRCEAVIDETPDMKTLVFSYESGALTFRPGQYMSIEVEIDGRTHSRCYSISSTPDDPERLDLTIKKEPGGLVSGWLHANVRPGTTIRAAGPFGTFVCDDDDDRDVVLLSAGSGITPMVSMLRWRGRKDLLNGVVFGHFARRPADIPFLQEIEEISARHCGLRLHLVCTRASKEDQWQGPTDRADSTFLRMLAPDPGNCVLYVCGPSGFMGSVTELAKAAGISEIISESFGGSSTALGARTDAKRDQWPIHILSGPGLSCAQDETILEAATREGVWLNASCRQGVCGSCKAKLVSGNVDMQDMGGLSDSEKQEGWILACCSRPVGPIAIELWP
ncbi:2Fe-2S iron-sulfur cluster binding domain-containing protein [Bradyrhizobium sp. BRP14]|nr:2Fe-2S iron-sulfur cluster binding domain-containing protein [Bradyrhizobium sp. BRP14]